MCSAEFSRCASRFLPPSSVTSSIPSTAVASASSGLDGLSSITCCAVSSDNASGCKQVSGDLQISRSIDGVGLINSPLQIPLYIIQKKENEKRKKEKKEKKRP